MAREQDLSRSRLRQEIETCHQEVLARCFAAAEGEGGDDALARKYAHLLRELANLPRDRVMALRFLPELLPVPAPKDEVRSASSSDEFVLFRRVAEAAGYGFVVTDLKGRIIYINPALCRMIGLNDGETGIGRSIYDFYPQPDRDDVMRRIIPAVVKAGQWTGELPLCCVRGRMTPTIQNLFVVHAGRGVAPALANLIIDITERKNAEEALRQSEERFRAVFENSAVGIYCTAPDGRILMANPALVRMLGYSSFEDLAGRNLETEGYEPQYPREAFKLELEREGGISGREAAWLRRDGTILYVRESARCIRDARGETLYYEGIAEDISARRAAEEALRTSEENFRALAENAHDGILIATGEGRHVFANPRAAEITGYTQSELLTMGFRQLAAPEEVQRLDENYRRRLAGQEVSARYETAIRTKDGRRAPIEVAAARTVWHGRLADIVVIRDISERLRAEQALRDSEERFRGLVEEVAEVLYSVDATGRLSYISPTIAHVSGYAAAEVIGRSFVDFVHPEEVEQARTNMAALLAGTEMEAHEYRLRFKSGENRWVRISSRPIRTDGAVTGVRGVITDIHDLKTAQFALEEADAIRQALAEHASDGIAIIEGERFRFANRTLCEMLGYTAEELTGKPVIDFIPPENHEAILARTRQDLAEEKTLRYGPLRVVCKDGTEKMIEFDGAVIRYHGRPAVIGLARDVTAQAAGEGKR